LSDSTEIILYYGPVLKLYKWPDLYTLKNWAAATAAAAAGASTAGASTAAWVITMIPTHSVDIQHVPVVLLQCSLWTFTLALRVVHNCPVKHKVILVALTEEEILQEATQIGVIGTVLEPQAAAVLCICDKLAWEVLAQYPHRRRYLLLHDLLILLLL